MDCGVVGRSFDVVVGPTCASHHANARPRALFFATQASISNLCRSRNPHARARVVRTVDVQEDQLGRVATTSTRVEKEPWRI